MAARLGFLAEAVRGFASQFFCAPLVGLQKIGPLQELRPVRWGGKRGLARIERSALVKTGNAPAERRAVALGVVRPEAALVGMQTSLSRVPVLVRTLFKERHMFDIKFPASPPIRIEIDVSPDLLTALGHWPCAAQLSNAERFEISALKIMVARALCLNKRARARS